MTRLSLLLAGYVVAVAAGVGIGYLVWRGGSPGPGPGQPGEVKAGEAAPDWRAWRYPGSAEHGLTETGGGQSGGVKSPMHYDVVLTTPDDYEKVLQYYAEKTGIRLVGFEKGGGSGGGNQELWFVTNDSLSRQEAGPKGTQTRPVRVKVFGKRTPAYDLTLFVSRADGESHTHIVLSYDRKR